MSDTNGAKPGLHAALIAARAAIPAIPKTHKNPHFGNKFASLGDILGAVLPALAANSLALLSRVEDGALVVELVHAETGECVSSKVPLLGGVDMQKLGGAMTYAQRYGIGTLLALELEDDDDGNRASGHGPGAARKATPANQPVRASSAAPDHSKVSAERARSIVNFRQSLGVGLMQSPHSSIPAADLTNAQADEIGRWHIEQRKQSAAPPAPHDTAHAHEVPGNEAVTAEAGGAVDELVDAAVDDVLFPDAPRAREQKPLTVDEQNRLAAAKERGKRVRA